MAKWEDEKEQVVIRAAENVQVGTGGREKEEAPDPHSELWEDSDRETGAAGLGLQVEKWARGIKKRMKDFVKIENDDSDDFKPSEEETLSRPYTDDACLQTELQACGAVMPATRQEALAQYRAWKSCEARQGLWESFNGKGGLTYYVAQFHTFCEEELSNIESIEDARGYGYHNILSMLAFKQQKAWAQQERRNAEVEASDADMLAAMHQELRIAAPAEVQPSAHVQPETLVAREAPKETIARQEGRQSLQRQLEALQAYMQKLDATRLALALKTETLMASLAGEQSLEACLATLGEALENVASLLELEPLDALKVAMAALDKRLLQIYAQYGRMEELEAYLGIL